MFLNNCPWAGYKGTGRIADKVFGEVEKTSKENGTITCETVPGQQGSTRQQNYFEYRLTL